MREENAKMRERKSLACGLKRGKEREKNMWCLEEEKEEILDVLGVEIDLLLFLRVFIQLFILIKIIRD